MKIKRVLTDFDAADIKRVDRLKLDEKIKTRSEFIREAVSEKLETIKNKDA